jgi:hypothetical protein
MEGGWRGVPPRLTLAIAFVATTLLRTGYYTPTTALFRANVLPNVAYAIISHMRTYVVPFHTSYNPLQL